jgi:hypothetical protein
VSVLDPRGVSVTLSHYCPTAAGLLDGPADAAIIEGPAAFPAGAEYVGLDVHTALPPLLRPDMLMDWEAWWEWERASVMLLLTEEERVDATLERLSARVEAVRGWSPGDGPLIDRVRRAHNGWTPAPPRTPPPTAVLVEAIRAAIPDDLRSSSSLEVAQRPDEVTLRRWLAAHAFASWTAHLGSGLRTWLRSIEAAHALIAAGSDIRRADLWLRHLADPRALADTWSSAEDP